MQNQTCFLLSYVKYGDNDAFLHCFSAESGYQSFFAKGIYAAKNKKKPYLFPLNLLNVSFQKKAGTNKVPTVSKLELTEEYAEFTDVKTHSILFFAAEFLNQVLREEDRHEMAFRTIQDFLRDIHRKNYSAHLQLMVDFLKICGIAPLSGVGEYLDPESGTFSPEKLHPLFTREISAVWKSFLEPVKDEKRSFKRELRNDFLDTILIYYHQHFTGFYTPNSLGVLRQIFE